MLSDIFHTCVKVLSFKTSLMVNVKAEAVIYNDWWCRFFMAIDSRPAPSREKNKRRKVFPYDYTARNKKNEIITGTMTAEDELVVAKRLTAMGYSPLSVEKARKLATNTRIGGQKRVKPKHLTVLAKQLSTMLDSGLPLVRALQAVSDQSDHPTLKETLPKVQSDVEAGKPLSLSLAKFPRVFPPLMCGLVAAGEISGELGTTLSTVSTNYAKEARLRSKVFSAMIYPIIVLCLAVIMVGVMLIFVVPRFATIFQELGGELPLPTRILVFASNIAVWTFPIVFVGGLIFLFWWRRNKNTRRVRDFVDPFKLKIPIFGKFFQKVTLARFSRTLSSLLNAGVPVIQALDITSETSGNIVIGDALTIVSREVSSGRPMGEPMSEFTIFPPLLQQMVITGEETGAVPEMLTRVAEFYEEEVDTAADALSATLEPILIVFLAGIIGSMVIALYLPMFKVFDLIN